MINSLEWKKYKMEMEFYKGGLLLFLNENKLNLIKVTNANKGAFHKSVF